MLKKLSSYSPKQLETLDGRFVKDLPRICPWCGKAFLTYRPAGIPKHPEFWKPNIVSPQIPKGNGAGDYICRSTCGSGRCWGHEIKYQEAREKADRDARLATRDTKKKPTKSEPPPPPWLA